MIALKTRWTISLLDVFVLHESLALTWRFQWRNFDRHVPTLEDIGEDAFEGQQMGS